MTLLGHTTLQMTSRYSHAMPANLRTAVDSLARGPLALVPKVVNAQSEPSLTVGLLPRSLLSRSARSAPNRRKVIMEK